MTWRAFRVRTDVAEANVPPRQELYTAAPEDRTQEAVAFLRPTALGAMQRDTGTLPDQPESAGATPRGLAPNVASFSDRVGAAEFVVPADPPKLVSRDAFIVSAHFEGHIEEVFDDGSFRARLADLGEGAGAAESAMFFATDVAEGDLPLVDVGAVFYWRVGQVKKASGMVENVSVVNFRRLPRWTAREMDQLLAETRTLAERLNWSKPDHTDENHDREPSTGTR